MEQHHELWYYAFDLIGDEYLIAEELDLVAVELIILDLWEVEHTCEVEWEIDVEVNPEEWIRTHWVEVVIELQIVIVLEVGWLTCPEWSSLVDLVVLFGIHFLAVLPFGLLAEDYRDRQILAILLEQAFDGRFLRHVLLVVIVEIEDDVGTALALVAVVHSEVRITLAAPFSSWFILV